MSPNPSSAVNSTTTLDFRASGLSGSGLVLTCCEFRPRRGNALGIRKRVESLLHKQWNPEQLRAGSRVRRDGVSVVSGWAVLLIWTSAGSVTPEQVQQHGQAQQAGLEMSWLQDSRSAMLRNEPSCCTDELNPRATLAENRHQHSRGGPSVVGEVKNYLCFRDFFSRPCCGPYSPVYLRSTFGKYIP